MNERPLSGSEKARANDRFWVSSATGQGGFRPVAGIRWLRDDPVMQMVSLLIATMGLLVCNLAYCGKRTMADVRHARKAEIAWGAMALSGSVLAMVSMVWATLASLAHL
ncbi:hypothetical protein [Sphingomonas zeae]|jgi:hypothetical protein|uniref:Uncharacterized protein n=1 Tax=Sphingomonas zeae TaxID=1646122 RepID=A0A7Y6B5S3_9SPHN|nr:hypothetical protein [Sphingomonas zeae]MBB4047904.1 hypothetical protein [Sphingomonas zeae]NUU47188.1 hypothetical protein [Sphingomonas zeae]